MSTTLHLAKFFHRAPGDDDRLLLLIVGWGKPPVVMEIGLGRSLEDEDLFRADPPTEADAVALYRGRIAERLEQGYRETEHTDYTRRELPPAPAAKPDWQRRVDEVLMERLAGRRDGLSALIAELAGTPAAAEPLALWLAGEQRLDAGDTAGARRLAGEAQAILDARKAADAPSYVWSMRLPEMRARLLDLLCDIEDADGTAEEAIEAARRAREAYESQPRAARHALLLCRHRPEQRDDAFDLAYRCGRFGGFEGVTAHPDYAAYLARREAQKRAGKPWRWSRDKAPQDADAIAAAEAALGRPLPAAYRRFLLKRGRSQLMVRLGEETTALAFHEAAALAEQRDNLVDWIAARAPTREAAEGFFREAYGVALADLVPVAEPWNESRCLVLHIGPGAAAGRCWLWDHDDPFELRACGKDVDAALKRITQGIERREDEVLGFLGVCVGED